MERAFDGTKKSNLDQEIEEQLLAHFQKHGIDALDAVKLFAVLGRRQWLKRFLAHAELFKQTLDVPGDIAELGVWRGAGLMTWANLLETYVVGNRTKTVYGFDNWEGFTSLAAEDGAQDAAAGKVVDAGVQFVFLIEALELGGCQDFAEQFQDLLVREQLLRHLDHLAMDLDDDGRFRREVGVGRPLVRHHAEHPLHVAARHAWLPPGWLPAAGCVAPQARSNSLMLVLARVCASTFLTMTAQYRLYLPSAEGRLPLTTTEPAGMRP